MNKVSMIREHFAVGPLQCNCSVIGDPVSKRALVVDPGGDAQHILDLLARHDLQLAALIHTHAHFDHILAAGELKEATGAPIYLHQEDFPLWQMLDLQCQSIGIDSPTLPDPDLWLTDDQALNCGGVVMHTPGHTTGSVSFWFESENLLLAGDTLFRGSVGRTDLPGGSFQQIEQSIRERLYTLDERALVITGHGPQTTIGEEMRSNNFVRPA